MEGWLQGSDCGRPWGPVDILQGEAPRGDIYQGHHLLQGTAGDREAKGGLAGRMPPLETFSLVSGGFEGSQLSLGRTYLLGEPI